MRQVGRQVPRRFVRQPLGIRGEHHRSPLPLGTVWTHVHLQRPPRLFVSIAEVAYNLHPISGASLSLPLLASRHGRLIRGAYLVFLVPPRVRGLQGQHVCCAEFLQGSFEAPVRAVERVGHHRPEGYIPLYGKLYQLRGDLELGAKSWVLLASLEVMRRGVRLEVHRIVDPLVGPQAAYAYDPALGLASYVGKPLPAYVRRMLAPLAVSVLVYYQHALLARSSGVLIDHELEATFVDLLRIPPRFRKEPLQALCFLSLGTCHGFGISKSGQSLVAFGRQEQTFQVAPERVALGAGAEDGIEAVNVVLKWAWSRASYWVAFGHSGTPPHPLEHGPRPCSTNYRYSTFHSS